MLFHLTDFTCFKFKMPALIETSKRNVTTSVTSYLRVWYQCGSKFNLVQFCSISLVSIGKNGHPNACYNYVFLTNMFTQDRPIPSNHISFHMINPHEVSSYIMIHHDTSWYIIISVPFVQSTELQVFFSNFLGPKNHLWRIQYFNRRGANNVFKKYQWNSSRPSLLACMVRHPTFLRVQGDECHNVSRYIYSMFGEYLET